MTTKGRVATDTSHGNTLAQAKRSAVLVGKSLIALWGGEGSS